MVRKSALTVLSLGLLAAASPAAVPNVGSGTLQLAPRVPTPGLIDDLLGGITTEIGLLIKDILNGLKSAQSDELSSKPLTCLLGLDPCCKWYDVSAALTDLFKGANGQCTDLARGAVRFGFHDAGAWSESSPNGGADGSLMMDFGEENRPENNGLQTIRTTLRSVQAKFGVGYADLAQFAHNHATVTCPRGPRIRTFVGRKDATKAAPEGLLPDVHSPADTLIKLFEDKSFTPHDLAALVGAHTSAKQRFVDTAQANKPMDTTPGVWDVEFYNETLHPPANGEIFVLPSDQVLSKHPRVEDEWKEFVGDQRHWNEDYAKAWVRMSLLGVGKSELGGLKECTRALPAAVPV
ncbi:ligninase LG6 precursor [Delitschia confertaspora ATCC 74209]|uniref:Peroxidase n=1 Tax=Delitschia confertaspora ATCC 74209 TaxID=1513339 RepID=A0A9P4JDI4_9PLEO|nr:ligninase LG6 precursor [Delitschia confertaspora ATCC 74209]